MAPLSSRQEFGLGRTATAALGAVMVATLGLGLLWALSIPPGAAATFFIETIPDSYVARTVVAGAIILGVMGGVLGSFAVARGQSLLGDAASHSALPGIFLVFMAWSVAGLGGTTVLGITLPEGRSLAVVLFGALASALVATALLLWASRGTRLPQDAALALTLSVFFGAGIVLRSYLQSRSDAFGNRAGLESFLYGSAATMTRQDVAVLAAMAIATLLLVAALWKELKVLAFDPDYLATLGYPVRRLDWMLTALIVVAVIVGLQMVGVILMSAMLIAPAVAARQWSDRLEVVAILASVFGVAGGVVGVMASASRSQVATGPVIAVYVTGLALMSVLVAPRRGVLARLWARRRQRRAFAVDTLLLHLVGLQSDEDARAARIDRIASDLDRPVRRIERWIDRATQQGWVHRSGDGIRPTDAGVDRALRRLRDVTPDVDRGPHSLEGCEPEAVR